MRPLLERYERLLDLIKKLHDFSGDRNDLHLALGIQNKKTLEKDRKSLKDGFKFLGWRIKIGNLKRGRLRAGVGSDPNDSTFHPLFFCLNLAELMALIEALHKSDRVVAERIIELTFKQLSPYAKAKIIRRFPELAEFGKTRIQLKNRQEAEYGDDEMFNIYCLKHVSGVKLILQNNQTVIGKPLRYDPETLRFFLLVSGHEESVHREDIRSVEPEEIVER